MCHLRTDIIQLSDIFAHFPGWVVFGFSSNKSPFVHTTVQRNLQEYAVCCPCSLVTLPISSKAMSHFWDHFLWGVAEDAEAASNCFGLPCVMCRDVSTAHVLACVQQSCCFWESSCKHKRRHFLPGQFSLGENIMGEGGTIHILDVGQGLLHLSKNKFNFRWTFHSLQRLNASYVIDITQDFKIQMLLKCCVSELCAVFYAVHYITANSKCPTISQDQTNGCEDLYINLLLPCAEYCRVVWIFEVLVRLVFVLCIRFFF